MKVTIKSFHAVAVWKWNTSDDQCAICYQPFDMNCETCSVPGESCPPAWGECSHHFHRHCIERWLANDNHTNCPMCRRPFKLRDDMHKEAGLPRVPSPGEDQSVGDEEMWLLDILPTAGRQQAN